MSTPPPDLAKLRIDRGIAPLRRRRRRKWIWLGVLALLLVGGAATFVLQPKVAGVHTTPVVTTPTVTAWNTSVRPVDVPAASWPRIDVIDGAPKSYFM